MDFHATLSVEWLLIIMINYHVYGLYMSTFIWTTFQPVKPHDDYYGQYKANTGIINNNNEGGKKLNNICLGARSNRTDNSD